MKKLITIAICILAAVLPGRAQDVIVKKNSTVIKAKILSVTDSAVEYKQADYLDGPTFTVNTDELSSITYSNGRIQRFENEEAKELRAKGITTNMSYDDYKNLYDARTYTRQPGDPYSPAGAGISSFFICGLGQIINGDVGRGVGMMLGTLGLDIAGIVSAVLWREKGDDGKYRSTTGGTICAICCFSGALAIDVWSICDAVKSAKIKNLYYRDCQKLLSSSTELKLMPSFSVVPAGQGVAAAPGMTLALKF